MPATPPHRPHCLLPLLQALTRITKVALACGLPALCALWLHRGRLLALFTSDPEAIAQAARILPLIILYVRGCDCSEGC